MEGGALYSAGASDAYCVFRAELPCDDVGYGVYAGAAGLAWYCELGSGAYCAYDADYGSYWRIVAGVTLGTGGLGLAGLVLSGVAACVYLAYEL